MLIALTNLLKCFSNPRGGCSRIGHEIRRKRPKHLHGACKMRAVPMYRVTPSMLHRFQLQGRDYMQDEFDLASHACQGGIALLRHWNSLASMSVPTILPILSHSGKTRLRKRGPGCMKLLMWQHEMLNCLCQILQIIYRSRQNIEPGR